jgi:cytochrome P450
VSVYWDPFDAGIAADPHPVFRRLRDEAPLYHNEKHGFYALSRFEDVERGLLDPQTYVSRHGDTLELIRARVPIPAGGLIFEDPPVHTRRRKLLSRVFTPRQMNALEPQARRFCRRSLEPLVGASRFDFVADVAAQMPLYMIGMLLGIPEADLESVRERSDARVRTETGKPMEYSDNHFTGEFFAEYVDWRARHPSDDLMTELLHAEFEEEGGATRRLTRQEVLTFTSVLATAGAETTVRMIGWAGKVLAGHPDQRRELVQDPSLIPGAIEEILRFEPPALNIARYVTRDVEHHGEVVPAGSTLALLVGSANRDERYHPGGDRFDIHRENRHHLSFGYGIHFCLGAALARLEGRVALEEVLKQFPEWEVDVAQAKLASTSIVRGWETLPVWVR